MNECVTVCIEYVLYYMRALLYLRAFVFAFVLMGLRLLFSSNAMGKLTHVAHNLLFIFHRMLYTFLSVCSIIMKNVLTLRYIIFSVFRALSLSFSKC